MGNQDGVVPFLEVPANPPPLPAISWDNCRKCNEPHHLKSNGLCLCCDAKESLVNPYQPPLPDEFLEDTVQGYEESIRTHEKTINGLRDRVRELEAENEALRGQFESLPVAVVCWEGANLD